jgi:hypothetical protein
MYRYFDIQRIGPKKEPLGQEKRANREEKVKKPRQDLTETREGRKNTAKYSGFCPCRGMKGGAAWLHEGTAGG